MYLAVPSCLYCSTAFGDVFTRERGRFNSMFRRRAMAHHYTEYITLDDIAHADEVVAAVCSDYELLNRQQLPLRRNYKGCGAGEAIDNVSPSANRTPRKVSVYDVNRSPAVANPRSEGEDTRYSWTPVIFPVF
jgi:hypothetical protein